MHGLYGNNGTGSRSGQASPAAAVQVTIQDVARSQPDVGPQTVSNVLNGSGRVSQATKARVLEAVAALGYHPHHGARSLRSRRTRQLAYVLPRIQLLPGNHIMQQFLQALAAASARQSHSVVVVVPDGDPRDEIRRLIASRTVDAFLLSDLQPDDPRVILLAEAGIRRSPASAGSAPGCRSTGSTSTTTRPWARPSSTSWPRATSRIAFVGYRSANLWDNERIAGFKARLARHGVPDGEADMLLVDEMKPARARRSGRCSPAFPGRPHAARPGLRPDAIVTGSDRLATMVYGVAAELRLRIGRDLGVTGFDGSVAADLLHPTLTSVTVPVDDIAGRVVARALRQLDHEPDRSPGRGSAGPAAAGREHRRPTSA